METTACSNKIATETSTPKHSHARRNVIIAVGIAVVAVVWYLFRPELLFINKNVDESFPVTTAGGLGAASLGQSRAQGTFHSAAHETKGTATIYELAGGKRLLRLTAFATSNGPDVHVLLGKAGDASDNATVKDAGYVDLGSLKGNIGDQNYEIPADVNPSDFKSVTIWCKRFSVNFGTAPLQLN
jgi:hypothetical protein